MVKNAPRRQRRERKQGPGTEKISKREPTTILEGRERQRHRQTATCWNTRAGERQGKLRDALEAFLSGASPLGMKGLWMCSPSAPFPIASKSLLLLSGVQSKTMGNHEQVTLPGDPERMETSHANLTALLCEQNV